MPTLLSLSTKWRRQRQARAPEHALGCFQRQGSGGGRVCRSSSRDEDNGDRSPRTGRNGEVGCPRALNGTEITLVARLIPSKAHRVCCGKATVQRYDAACFAGGRLRAGSAAKAGPAPGHNVQIVFSICLASGARLKFSVYFRVQRKTGTTPEAKPVPQRTGIGWAARN